MPDLSPAQKKYLACVRREKISDPCVQDLSVPGLSPFVGSICQTGMDRFFYLQQSV